MENLGKDSATGQTIDLKSDRHTHKCGQTGKRTTTKTRCCLVDDLEIFSMRRKNFREKWPKKGRRICGFSKKSDEFSIRTDPLFLRPPWRQCTVVARHIRKQTKHTVCYSHTSNRAISTQACAIIAIERRCCDRKFDQNRLKKERSTSTGGQEKAWNLSK